MPMHLEIDGNALPSEAAFHSAVREASGVEWYGGSLDGLFDVLVAACEPPLALRWRNLDASRARIGSRIDRIVQVLLDAEAERGPSLFTLALER